MLQPKQIVVGSSIFSIPASEIHRRSNSIETVASWWLTTRQLFGLKHQEDYIIWPGAGLLLSIDAAMRIAADREDYLLMGELAKYQRNTVAV